VRVFDGAALVNASAVRIDGPAVVAIGDPSVIRPGDEIIDGQQGTSVDDVRTLPNDP
jgi:hypothetical protein